MLSLHFCLCVYGNPNALIKFINLQAAQNKSVMFGGGGDQNVSQSDYFTSMGDLQPFLASYIFHFLLGVV